MKMWIMCRQLWGNFRFPNCCISAVQYCLHQFPKIKKIMAGFGCNLSQVYLFLAQISLNIQHSILDVLIIIYSHRLFLSDHFPSINNHVKHQQSLMIYLGNKKNPNTCSLCAPHTTLCWPTGVFVLIIQHVAKCPINNTTSCASQFENILTLRDAPSSRRMYVYGTRQCTMLRDMNQCPASLWRRAIRTQSSRDECRCVYEQLVYILYSLPFTECHVLSDGGLVF